MRVECQGLELPVENVALQTERRDLGVRAGGGQAGQQRGLGKKDGHIGSVDSCLGRRFLQTLLSKLQAVGDAPALGSEGSEHERCMLRL